MTTPSLRIRLVDIDRGKADYDWDLSVEWLKHAFQDTDAVAAGPGHLKLGASKDGQQVILQGWATAQVTMPCARTTEPVPVALNAEIILLLRPAPTTSARGGAIQPSKRKGRSSKGTGLLGETETVGNRKSAKGPEAELTWEDAAEDYYSGEHIDLDELVREFLILELPMMPLRSDLRFEGRPAIPATPESKIGDDADSIDPRLRPLAEIASRLKKSIKE